MKKEEYKKPNLESVKLETESAILQISGMPRPPQPGAPYYL